MKHFRLGLAGWLAVGITMAMASPMTARATPSASVLAGVPTPEGEPPGPDWIETRDGDLPIIISVPHGGDLRPADIPDRRDAVVLNDPGSLQFSLDLADALAGLTGRRPFLVINHLGRSKLDPNRSLTLGAQHSPAAESAWKAYHDAVKRAERLAARACGWGVYFDLHSNGRPVPRIEFGYGLTVGDLDRADAALDDRQFAVRSNLRSLATWGTDELSSLLRGDNSLGGRLEAHGYSVAPSPDHPVPQANYFDGGLSVALHGSRYGGAVDAVQIEVPVAQLEDARRGVLARLMAEAIVGWMDQAYGFDLASPGPICSGFADVRMDAPGAEAVAALSSADGLPACGQNPARLCPSESLTRAEAAEAVWRVGFKGVVSGTGQASETFADLPSDAGQRAAIAALSGSGLLQACALEPLRYCPGLPESRADAAFIGLRLLKGPSYVPPPPRGLFTDVSTGTWSTWWLEAAYQAGLLSACRGAGNRHICPDAPIARLDFARLIDGALARRQP